MNLFEEPKAKPAAPCACCAKSALWQVWGVDVCAACHAAWTGDDRFSVGSINAALGLSNTPDEFTPEGHRRYCAEAEKRTKAWVGEMRRRAA